MCVAWAPTTVRRCWGSFGLGREGREGESGVCGAPGSGFGRYRQCRRQVLARLTPVCCRLVLSSLPGTISHALHAAASLLVECALVQCYAPTYSEATTEACSWTPIYPTNASDFHWAGYR